MMQDALLASKGASLLDKQATQSPGPDTPKVPSALLFSAFAAGQPRLPVPRLRQKSTASAAASPSIQPQVCQQKCMPGSANSAARFRTCSMQDGHAELHDDTWRGAIPWRVLYPTKALPVHASPHCSAAPSSDQTTNHKDAASSAGTTPTYMETDHEIQYKGEDLQYNPMLVDLIRNINHSSKSKKAAVTAAASATARPESREACTPGSVCCRQSSAGTSVAAPSPTSSLPIIGRPTPTLPAAPATGYVLQPQEINPALRSALHRLNKLQKYDKLYTKEEGGERTLRAMFGPGVPIWRMVEDLEMSRRVSAADKLYLLGSSTNQGAKRRHLMLLLQPLVGQYVLQRRMITKLGTARHKFAAWKLKQAQLTPAEAARYNSPCTDFMKGCQEDCMNMDCDEAISSYGTGCSWSAHPSQAVYTYQLMPENYEKLTQLVRCRR